MKIEPGKSYTTRDGQTAFVEGHKPGFYCFYGTVDGRTHPVTEKHCAFSWAKNGRYLKDEPHGFDLVELIEPVGEMFPNWHEAFDTCRERDRPLVAQVGQEVCKIFPSGSYKEINKR